MERKAVASSLLESVGYDPTTRTLELSFKPKKDGELPKVYRYADVSEETYQKFVDSPSLGKYFLSTIKPAHPCTRIKETEDAKTKQSVSQDRAPDGDPIPF